MTTLREILLAVAKEGRAIDDGARDWDAVDLLIAIAEDQDDGYYQLEAQAQWMDSEDGGTISLFDEQGYVKNPPLFSVRRAESHDS